MIEPTLDTLLRVVEIISILGGGGVVAFRLGRTTEKMQAAIESQNESAVRQSNDIADLKAEIRKLSDILTRLAVQEHRLDMLDQRYEELRHGEGFVYPMMRAPPPAS